MDTKEENLKAFIKSKIQEAKNSGEEEFFMGIPDSWFDNGQHCCPNGHVNNGYLKSEALGGAVCFDCHEPSHIFPSNATVEELNEYLNSAEAKNEATPNRK